MNLSEITKELLKNMHISIVEVAGLINQSPQNLGNKIRRGTLSDEDFTSIINVIGVTAEVKLTYPSDKNNSNNNLKDYSEKYNLLKSEIDFQAKQIDYLRILLKELRTNFNVIYSCNDYINRNVSDSARVSRGVKTIDTANNQIKNLLDEGLNLSDLQPINSQVVDANFDFSKLKFLIVDDNNLNLEISKDVLEDYHINVETAMDGFMAVERFKSHETSYYDVILMDIEMPNLNGIEACRLIRSLPGGSEPIIIAVTSDVDEKDKQLAMDAGMNFYTTKPIKMDQILKFIENLIKGGNRE